MGTALTIRCWTCVPAVSLVQTLGLEQGENPPPPQTPLLRTPLLSDIMHTPLLTGAVVVRTRAPGNEKNVG